MGSNVCHTTAMSIPPDRRFVHVKPLNEQPVFIQLSGTPELAAHVHLASSKFSPDCAAASEELPAGADDHSVERVRKVRALTAKLY